MGNIHIENMFARKSTIRRRGETLVKYTTASGLEDWIGLITGQIAGTSASPYYTSQIPNVEYAETIQIGKTVTGIGEYAFYYCTNLTSVTISDSVTSIGNYAFRGCSSLTDITIPDSVKTFGIGSFRGTGITNLEVPDDIPNIPIYLVADCTQLQNVSLGKNVERILVSGFSGCTSLVNITFSDALSVIGQSAFYSCSSLPSLTMPRNITRIYSLAFSGCSSCEIFDFRKATQVPTLDNASAFNNTPANKEIIVPDNLYDDWIAASNWSSTTNNIVNCIVKASQSSLGVLA